MTRRPAGQRQAVFRHPLTVLVLLLAQVAVACSWSQPELARPAPESAASNALKSTTDDVFPDLQTPRAAKRLASPSASDSATGETPGHDTEPSMILRTFNSRDRYLPEQVEFINGLLRFAKTVTVLSEVEEGPLFDPDTQEIWMPGSFADVIESHFGEDDAPVGDVYLHTLVHEVGHVLFAQYDLPLLAREEDAADALASVLLLEYADDGARVVLNAARMFGLESESSTAIDEMDFWSEHSLDIQRYYTTLCHVYGSDPEGQVQLLKEEYGLTPERASNCQYEYARIRKAWLNVLAPYLKR